MRERKRDELRRKERQTGRVAQRNTDMVKE